MKHISVLFSRGLQLRVPIQIFFIYAWLTNLPGTDSFFSIYCLYALAGVLCLLDNERGQLHFSPRFYWGSSFFSALFSLSVILGNYSLFQPFHALMSLFNMALCFAGGFFIGLNILLWAANQFPIAPEKTARNHGGRFYITCFLSIVLIDLFYLLATNYPAVFDKDTMAQFFQILNEEPLTNWTPYWHTVTVSFFINVGLQLFEDINQALVFYEVCQILFISAVQAYTLLTFYEIGLPKFCLCAAYYLYALLPYNIVFNVTIGKDILFGVGLLLFVTGLFRIITETGKHPVVNYLAFLVGSIGFCSWRTNGWYVYWLTAFVIFFLLRKSNKLLIGLMCLVLVFCWFLQNPFLDAQEIDQPPVTETMGIPFQQIARVIVNEREISQEEEAFLSEIFHLDQIAELYTPERADPIKFDAFRHSHYDYFTENIGDFLKVWLRLGFQYPEDYILAWIDETRGYWNGGYDMGVYEQGIPGNSLGMYNSGGDTIFAKLFHAYFRYIEDPGILAPLKSIGFVVWIILGCLTLNLLKKRRVWILILPVLIILIGLWIGTPVFAEFRYAYPVFLISPLILCTTLYDRETI